MSRWAADPDYRLFCEERLPNPYPLFHRLRAEDPVHWCEPMNLWLVTRFDDVFRGLRDPRFSSDRTGMYIQALSAGQKTRIERLLSHISKWVQQTDEPAHGRLRKLVNQAFTPKLINLRRPRIVRLAESLLEGAGAGEPFDLVSCFCAPLPAIVICELLGIPSDDQEKFRRASGRLMQFSSRGGASMKEHAESALAALDELVSLFQRLLEERRRLPREDLLGALASARADGERLSDDELYAMCVFLFLAGHETTSGGISNGVLALLQHPDQFAALKTDVDGLVGGAVEEALRYDSPVPRAVRLAREDLSIGEKRIAAGQLVVFLLGAANRDPAEFPHPDRFEIRRKAPRHLAFGHGLHYCLGALLARIEMEISFRAIVRRLPGLRLGGGEPQWKPIMGVRALQILPVLSA